MAWKEVLLERAAARDAKTDGLVGLYEQYAAMLRDNRAAQRRDGQRSVWAAKRWTIGGSQSAGSDLSQADVAKEEAESAAKEKEAEPTSSKDATRLGEENASLKAQLEKTKAEKDRLVAQLAGLRRAERGDAAVSSDEDWETC
eukprot:TRINITY_DN48788_c0_g1_i1.p1 TRINITY_DN48788_c0_g1~~TRINITY_DN48788_c0_g1_i1.p1  ORF type:complete len:143 (+),score=47.17 TRINITY_DN48788_c0_g1_i1:104-532(+)